MKNHELYPYLLRLESPCSVGKGSLDVEQQRVDVVVKHLDNTSWPCPRCGCQLPTYDHAKERVWRHLDSCQFKTYLHASIPRVQCKEHGVAQVEGSLGQSSLTIYLAI